MNSLYLDLEYDNDRNIIEIGAVNIQGGYITSYFHCFIRRSVSNLIPYLQCAQNSHCIHPGVLNSEGLPYDAAMTDFENFIINIKGTIVLKGHGSDMTKTNLEMLFPFLNKHKISFMQVNLPNWKERQFLKSHICALNMKNASKLLPCHKDFHSIKYSPSWLYEKLIPNETKIAKLSYSFHCGFIDAMEMAMFDNAVELYTCDRQFRDIILCNIPEPPKPTYFNSYYPIIEQTPLVFFDV